jgi:predicted RNA-binding protein with TRAM domain
VSTPVRLGDIADVQIADVQSTGYARLDGARRRLVVAQAAVSPR